MNYPGLSRSLQNQVTVPEYEVIKDYIEKVEQLSWTDNNEACRLLEAAAKKALDHDYFRCCARILYYYEKFFMPT